MSADQVGVALVYPALLGTYGDGGNAIVLVQRLRWRGVRAELLTVDVGAPLPRRADIYVLGGGEDTAQTLATEQLRADGTLPRAAADGRVVFAVCAGYQVLGRTFLDGAGRTYAGLELLDCATDRLPATRAVGELLAEPLVAGLPTLTGYENHGGRTTLGTDTAPLARVTAGVGNGDGTEGAVRGTVLATYAHGPVLARNPALADHLLRLAVGDLPPLDDSEEEELRRNRLAAGSRRSRRQFRPAATDGISRT